MTKAEAWLQCSARGTTVTRLAYIGGFHPSCVGDPEIEPSRERRPRNAGSFSPFVTSSPTSSSHPCTITQLEERPVLVILCYILTRIVLQ